jgi:gamma-glutamyltranspeptidase/glutathione hydrolase
MTILVAGLGAFQVQAQSPALEAKHGMVVSTHHLASAAGVEMMQRGGNAIDAAVATGFALAVVSPSNGNLGGGGFMIIRPADGRAVALDFREVAPLAATADMYLNAEGNVEAGRSTLGYLANGVPGSVAGLEHAWSHYGSGNISWVEVIEPARRLAAQGFVLGATLTGKFQDKRENLALNAPSRKIFLRDGDYYAAGEKFIQSDLAETLERIQRHGVDDFYRGETARLIVADQKRGGGLITAEDLATYTVIEREPIRGTYRGYEFLTMPPPSSGGIALAQMLGMLEPYDVRSMGLNSTAYIHLVTETMRRAFRDRAEYLGDPAFYPVPQSALTEAHYIQRLMANFDPQRATPSDSLAPGNPLVTESTETTHFSVVDADGNIASCTTTLNGNFGNCVTVAGAGFLMNNEMDDFTAKIGVKNMFGLIQGEANAIAPRKRPLSSMTPTIVLRDGNPFLVTGSPGGPTIITTVLQVMLNVIDHRLPLSLATDAPRFHHQWRPDDIKHEPFLGSTDTLSALESMGHVFALRKLYAEESAAAARYWGDAESILIDPATQRLIGVSDKRMPDAAPAGF